jgi:WbqC-like protein
MPPLTPGTSASRRVDKTVAIVQSSYIPWKGYFDLIARSSEFILFDDVQYTKRDWRSRNRIKTHNGLHWLSIPVNVSGRYLQAVKDVTISERGWNIKHWKTIAANYAQAPFFRDYRDRIEHLYCEATDASLSAVNHRFIAGLCEIIGIHTRISWSMDYALVDGRTERLVELCRQAGATRYLSGPSAKGYIEPGLFERAGVELEFVDHSGYREYPQLFPPFEHGVSVVDLIFNVGPAARDYLSRS